MLKYIFDMVKTNYYTAILFGAILGICCTALTLFLIGNFKSEFVFKTENLDNNMVDELWNLEEGIDGGRRYIDQTIPRY